MKKTRFIISLFLVLFVFVLVSCGEKHKGVYYEYIDGIKQNNTYFILEKNNWEDESGDSGKYKITGTDIDFYTTFFGAETVLFSGTIKDGVITFTIFYEDYVYARDGKLPERVEESELNIVDSRIKKTNDGLTIKLAEEVDRYDFTNKFTTSKGTYYGIYETAGGSGNLLNNTVIVSGYSKVVYLIIKGDNYNNIIDSYKITVTRDLPFTVSFYDDNGRYLSSNDVRSGNKVENPPNSLISSKDGMSFVGWGIESNGKVTPIDLDNYLVEGNIDLYPVYTYNQYKVNYNIEYDNKMDGTHSLAMYNSKFKLNVPTSNKPGYTFDGWMDSYGSRVTDEKGNSLYVYDLTKQMDVFAMWVESVHDVNVTISHAAAGVITQSKQTAKYEETITLKTTISNGLGYKFLGWYEGNKLIDTKLEIEFKMPDKTINYTARYELITYTITYDVDGGINNSRNISSYTIESKNLVLNDATKTHYSFVEWRYNNSKVETLALSEMLKNITVKAIYEPAKYDVTLMNEETNNPKVNIGFHPNGASGNFYYSEATRNSGPTLPENPQRTGYLFAGWNTKVDGTGVTYNVTNTFSSDTILYAKWISNSSLSSYNEIFTNTRTSNNKNISTYKFAVIATGTEKSITVSINNSGTSSYYNVYSITAPNGNTLITNATQAYTITNPLAGIYIVDSKPYNSSSNNYSFKFSTTYNNSEKFNGIEYKEVITTYNQKTNLPVPVKRDYAFMGWYTQPNGKGEQVTNDKGVMLNVWTFPNLYILYAKWEQKEYTLTYYLNEGVNNKDNITSLDMIDGYFELKEPIKEYNTFDGWYDSSSYKDEITRVYEHMWGDINLYAKFIPDKFNITYNVGISGATNNNPTIRDYGEAINLSNASKTGYRFLGWYDQQTEGNKVTVIAKNVHENVTLYGRWEIIEYSLTYNLNGGTNNVNQQLTYTITTPTFNLLNPTKEYYDFGGWYTNSSLTGDKVTNIAVGSTGNKTFYAKFTLKEYNITYSLGGGNVTGQQTKYTYESEFDLVEPTRAGYEFLGWYTEATGGVKVTKINKNSFGDKTFYARWEIINYTIIYYLNDGTNNLNQETYTIETPTITLTNVSKEYYVFNGWYDNEAFSGSKVTSISKGSLGDKVLYAKFTPTQYTITYNLDGGSLSGANSSYNYESEFDLKNPTKNGYQFIGWYTSEFGGERVLKISLKSSGNKTFYARWELLNYKINYENSTNHDNPSTYNVNSDTIVLTKAIKEHYIFDGWYTNANLTSKISLINKGSFGELTLYAKFMPVNYKVTYELDEGTLLNPDNSYNYESEFDLKIPTKTGYTFDGWYTSKTGGVKVSKIVLKSFGDKTFYARWEEISYDIIYTLNGGTNSSFNKDKYTINSDTITLSSPSRVGYVFVNWVNENNKVIEEIEKGSIGTINLTALWELKNYVVNYYLYGGENHESNPYSVTTLTPNFTLLAPTKAGYTFDGWYSNAVFNQTVTSINSGTVSDVHLHAKFTALEFTITFESNGGSALTSILVKTDEVLELPKPTKAGQSLEGWYLDNDLTVKFTSETMPPNDLKLYAKWIPYDIKFNYSSIKRAIKVTQDLTSPEEIAEIINLIILDTDGKKPQELSVEVSGKVEVGGQIQLIFIAKGLREQKQAIYTAENIKVYGIPSINVKEDIKAVNEGDLIDDKLFGLTGKDSFNQNATVEVIVVNSDYQAGDIISVILKVVDVAGNTNEVTAQNIKVYGNPTITHNDVTEINEDTEITTELFDALAKDSFDEDLEIELLVTGNKVSGNTITVTLKVTESNGVTLTKEIEVKVYGKPTIIIGDNRNIKVDDVINKELFDVVALDSFNNEISNVEFTLVEGILEKGELVKYEIKVTDHMGNSSNQIIEGIKVYGTPELEFNKDKTAIKLIDDLNASLFNAVARDSFGKLLDVDINMVSGQFGSGNSVILNFSAIDFLGNSISVNHDVKVYGLQDIIFTYNLGASEISIYSIGKEFNVVAKDAFNEPIVIEYVKANDGKIVAGQTQDIKIKVTDVAGNTKYSDVIKNIKVYDNPTINFRIESNIYLEIGGNIGFTYFVARDSFNQELIPTIKIIEGSTSTLGLLKVQVEAKDASNNVTTKVFELLVIEEDEYFVRLDATLGAHVLFDMIGLKLDEDYQLPIPSKEHYTFVGWYKDDVKYTDEEGSSLTPWIHDEHNIYLTAKYIEIEYNITYILDDGVNHIDQVNVFTISSDGLLLNPTKEDYLFNGWYLEESFTTRVYSISDLELNDVTLYAKFVDELILGVPKISYNNNTLNWTSPDHEYVDRYHLYIDGEFVKDLGYNLYYDEIDDYINDGLRHEIQLTAIGLGNVISSELSNKLIKLETLIINETNEELISSKRMSWKAIFGASAYKIIKEDEEVILDSNVLTYNFSNYAGTTLKLLVIGEGSYINSEIKEIDLPNVKIEGSFVYLGKYPQTVVDNTSLINELNKLTVTNSNGYYEYQGVEYAKLSANPYNTNYTFSNGQTIVKNNIYYFKVEPIKWRILQQASGTYTLLTDMILDQEMFYTSTSSRTIGGKTIYANNYEHSTIREWLNNGFYNKAFKAGDKTVILTSFIDNSASTTYSSSNQYACNNTNDKVYLLSYQEASNIYFSSNSQRQAIASDYARARNVYIASNNFSYWWLRSPSDSNSRSASYVDIDGGIYSFLVDRASYGVRPALKIKID